MTRGPRRVRTQRRELDRSLRKAVRAREKLVATGPGGGPGRAIPVSSASVIEVRARGTPCPQCGGELELRGHAAVPEGGGALRVVRLVCRLCHAPREIWFRIEPTQPS